MIDVNVVVKLMEGIEWFANVGSPFVLDSELNVVELQSWTSAIQRRSRNKSTNAFLEASNIYTCEVGLNFRKEYRKWNGFVQETYDALDNEVLPTAHAVVDSIPTFAEDEEYAEYLKGSIRWDLIHIMMEHVYSDLVPPKFYGFMLTVYKAGHFPCDWDEAWPNGKLWLY